MDKATVSASAILAVTCAIALYSRLALPEIQPVLTDMRIIFYMMLAVTVIAILRNVLGLVTYGVFGPAIISLSLVFVGDLLVGFTILASLLAAGLLVRFSLEPLRLQMTHRLAIVVIALSATIAFLKIAGLRLGDDSLALAGFLPILISAWIVERFARDRWESGWRHGTKRLGYTLIAVLVSLALINDHTLVTYFVYTPETWTLPVVLNLLIGSSVRLRLSEYFRFRRLARREQRPGKGFSGILTMNVRNRDYIDRYNSKTVYPSITKLRVKETLLKNGIPVPATLAAVESQRDLKDLEKTVSSLPSSGFVLKPDNGFGGRGIIVVGQRKGNVFETVGGKQLTLHEMRQQIEMTLDGEPSRRWLPDRCLIEERVSTDPVLGKLSHSGLPDIRVIIFMGVPVMAMARLPTSKSGGRANLHQGAVGAGIDLVSGKITRAVWGHERKPIAHHPDTRELLIGEQIPFWNDILSLAIASQKATGLGYAGVDLVIDKDRGPLVMEVNKRPGIEIQNANGRPLLQRLQSVEAFLAEGIRIMRFLEARNWNYAENEEDSEEIQ